jgi:hypothetical protein
LYDIIKKEFTKIVKEDGLESERMVIKAAALSTEEAIGNPEDKDDPLIVGRERMMQAEFRGCVGQAFTDMYGDYSGKLSDIIEMELKNNFRRAIFISSLNAVMRYLGLIDKTAHCKNNEPPKCSQELVKYVESNYGNPKIAFIGFQPRMIQALAPRFELRVTDLDKENIGQEKFGVMVDGPEKAQQNLDWCDLALVTGTTVVNDTFSQFAEFEPVVFYGVTISGVARLLGLNCYCYCGH